MVYKVKVDKSQKSFFNFRPILNENTRNNCHSSSYMEKLMKSNLVQFFEDENENTV